jgi:hypothetical protein
MDSSSVSSIPWLFERCLVLKVKDLQLSETSVNVYQSTRRKVLENANLQQNRSENPILTESI